MTILKTVTNYYGASLVTQLVKNPPAMREAWGRFLGWEDPLEKEMATRLSILKSGFPEVAVVKSPPVGAGDARHTGSVPGSGRSPGEGNGHPLQYSCLENSMDKGAWWATINGVMKSQTQLSDLTLSLLT